MYKIYKPLKTRQVEPFVSWYAEQKETPMTTLSRNLGYVNKAVECGWFEGEQPEPGEMLPPDVVELGTKIFLELGEALGLDAKNAPARSESQTLPKKPKAPKNRAS